MGTFSDQLAKFAATSQEQANRIAGQVLIDLGESVVDLSPVASGAFKANWQVGIGSVPSPSNNAPDPSASSVKQALHTVANEGIGGKTVYVVNQKPYARRLEYGWSKQAPAGFVGVTVVNFQGIVLRAVGENR